MNYMKNIIYAILHSAMLSMEQRIWILEGYMKILFILN